ncbi:MAG: SMC-Scp complex subunit ScpB [Ruminococcaceae bacterium]|nr:SMC-Scp complex subunit ScpB [Oscillospiraceae bacterium]
MKKEELFGILESILFALGSPAEFSRLEDALEMTHDEIVDLATDFMKDFNKKSRGMKVIRLENSIQMVSRSEHHPYIAKMLETRAQRGLSQSSLETLSIIAYNQPVTKAMVDAVRGVDSYNSIVRLLERELIEQRGRMDAPGRPMLYGTTSEFLRVFGMESLDELPKLELKLLQNINHTDNLTFSDIVSEEGNQEEKPEEAMV